MILRELLKIISGETYICDDEGEILFMVDTDVCNFEYTISDNTLDDKVLCVFCQDGKLKVMLDE